MFHQLGATLDQRYPLHQLLHCCNHCISCCTAAPAASAAVLAASAAAPASESPGLELVLVKAADEDIHVWQEGAGGTVAAARASRTGRVSRSFDVRNRSDQCT